MFKLTPQRELEPLLLQIDPIIERASEIQKEVEETLSNHSGLHRVCAEVVEVAKNSKESAKRMKRLWALPRLPLYFFILIVILGLWWIYRNFFYADKVRLALPSRDTASFSRKIKARRLFEIIMVPSKGASEGLSMMEEDKADLSFVQGGIDFPPEYRFLETPDKEMVLFLVRKGAKVPEGIKKVCTSVKDQESHSFAKKCLSILGITPLFVHTWPDLTDNPEYCLPSDVDAIFVVKNLGEEKHILTLKRAAAMGFEFADTDIGVYGESLSYLNKTTIPPGYFSPAPFLLPSREIKSYRVDTYLIAHPRVTPIQFQEVVNTFYPQQSMVEKERGKREVVGEGFLYRVSAIGEIIASLSIILVALFGLSIVSYRLRFNELNTLISLINIHQSKKDLYEEKDPEVRKEYRHYLATCSDLLGLIDIITGYYAQENPTLLFNGFSNIIHQRCLSLKLNIQMKIQHANLKYMRMIYQLMRELQSPKKQNNNG